jgi:hypothetical protein
MPNGEGGNLTFKWLAGIAIGIIGLGGAAWASWVSSGVLDQRDRMIRVEESVKGIDKKLDDLKGGK